MFRPSQPSSLEVSTEKPPASSIIEVSAIMFLMYGDESLDETSSRVCAVGGLVGTTEAWSLLEAKWSALHGEVPFHAKDCDSDHGDYAVKPGEHPDERHRYNKSLYKNSITLLVNSDIGGYGSAYDLISQRDLFPHSPPVYYQPFMDVLTAMYGFVENKDGFAELTFDSRLESDHNAGMIYANMWEDNPEWRARFASKISFECSRKNTRIQIADLFVREAMKHLDNQLAPKKRPPRESWKALKSTGRFYFQCRGREYWEKMKAEDPYSQVKALGIQPGQFQAWLDARGRQWNLTAYYEFLRWRFEQMTPEQKDELGKILRPYY